jgi:hypothetical protein
MSALTHIGSQLTRGRQRLVRQFREHARASRRVERGLPAHDPRDQAHRPALLPS